ncbi:ATP-dependent zinc metalloprotease FtsH [Polyangium mundeleinium]|uniref:ATP-dependent zinc metalloprotease FtsH n=1 Tax=Polyangium mundeleinium TaxID=2995306 RepID=A0ABT5EI70_9BACT|nr:ATP-dependent zinc metalloprotease FtsH [Polyangium mundeleinium]MDC0741512.1 ATP-dependent zinc metalloprotease FtsH [Polyangium mundeleinium]
MRSFWVYILLVVGAVLLLGSLEGSEERIPYARFRDMAEQGVLTEVQIKGDTYIGRTAPNAPVGTSQTFRTGRIEGAETALLATLDAKDVPYTRVSDGGPSLSMMLLWALPLVGVLLLVGSMSRKAPTPNITNPALNFGKHKARLYVDKGAPITFRDVAGSHEAKAELAEIVEFLKAPERYRRLGGRIPKGCLLVGPPGTGKTLLARAVAGEANVPFFSICGSEFVEMFVGVGAARVRDLFTQAREKPAAILFVDELDAVGKARGAAGPIGGNDEREQTLNQLLTEMDGFDGATGLVVIAATNRPEILDPALTRAGRFDRRVYVDRPDLRERREILEVHARRVLLGPDVNLDDMAAQTTGLVGADLANLLNESALLAARRHATAVSKLDLDEAIERVIAGLERKSRRLGAHERVVVAYHEAGHAITAELLPTQDPVRKVSIVPRGIGALGYTLQKPREDRYLMSRQEILDRLVVLLGGRVAEQRTFGDASTGAQDDLVNATDIARRMVRELGMGGSALGLASFDPRRSVTFERGGYDYSEETARVVDAEVGRLLADAEARTKALINEHFEALERIARRLLEVETLSGEEVRALLHAPSAEKPKGAEAENVDVAIEDVPTSEARPRAACR